MFEAPIDLVSDSDEEGGLEPIDVEAYILGPVLAAARPVKTEPRGEQRRPAAAAAGGAETGRTPTDHGVEQALVQAAGHTAGAEQPSAKKARVLDQRMAALPLALWRAAKGGDVPEAGRLLSAGADKNKVRIATLPSPHLPTPHPQKRQEMNTSGWICRVSAA